MLKLIRSIILIIILFLPAFSIMEDDKIDTEFFYNLQFLKKSTRPRKLKIINIDNMAFKKETVQSGILLTYKNRNAKDVSVAGDFSNWQALKMNRGNFGVWYYFLSNKIEAEKHGRNKIMRYKYNVDGVWINDIENPYKEDDGLGSYISIIRPIKKSKSKHVSFKFIEKNLVEFQIYKPEAKLISIVGDFNHWNPENDLMEKGDDGIWRIKKRLYRGTYRYKFIVDGKWIVDLFNENHYSDGIGGISSEIRIE